jgi:hypothetical protein
VLVDGRRFADQTPVYRAPIAPGKHKVSIVSPLKPGSPVREVVVVPGKIQVVGFDW